MQMDTLLRCGPRGGHLCQDAAADTGPPCAFHGVNPRTVWKGLAGRSNLSKSRAELTCRMAAGTMVSTIAKMREPRSKRGSKKSSTRVALREFTQAYCGVLLLSTRATNKREARRKTWGPKFDRSGRRRSAPRKFENFHCT